MKEAEASRPDGKRDWELSEFELLARVGYESLQVHPKDGGVPCGSQDKVPWATSRLRVHRTDCSGIRFRRFRSHMSVLKATSLSEMEHCPPEPGCFEF